MTISKFLQIGEVLRYSKPYSRDTAAIDGYRNFHFATAPDDPGGKHLLLESGINRVAILQTPSGPRRPAILIRSTPWKSGTVSTPWTDEFDLPNRHVRYFGDHKVTTKGEVGATAGNKALLEAWPLHSSNNASERSGAPPLAVFRAAEPGGKRARSRKGYVEFCGVAIIRSLREVTLQDPTTNDFYPNLEVDLRLVPSEPKGVDWRWINDRRSPQLSDVEALAHAPAAWRRWVNTDESIP